MPVPGFLAGWSISPFVKELPFTTREEVIDRLPSYMHEGDVPVRDAIADAMLEAMARYVSDTAKDAARTDAAYAEGEDLDLIGLNKLERSLAELDGSYRERLLRTDLGVSPRALLEAIDNILAPLGYTGVAYYNECPEDEVFFFDQDFDVGADGTLTGNTDGWFVGISGEGALEYEKRYYDARTRCRPRHAFFFGTFRDEATRKTLHAAGTDYTDAFNAWGSNLIGIPAFATPGEVDPVDAFIAELPRIANSLTTLAPLVDVTGELSAAGKALDADTCDLFDLATADATSGAVIFSADGDGQTAIVAIQALLESRSAFPTQYTVVLDPEL